MRKIKLYRSKENRERQKKLNDELGNLFVEAISLLKQGKEYNHLFNIEKIKL